MQLLRQLFNIGDEVGDYQAIALIYEAYTRTRLELEMRGKMK